MDPAFSLLSTLPCGVCKDLWVSPNYFGGNDRKNFTIKRPVDEWLVSAELGCPLCYWILYSPACHQPFEWSMIRNFDLAPEVDILTFDIMRLGGESVMILGPRESPSDKMKLITLYMMAEEGSPAANYIKLRPTPAANGIETFDTACGWLKSCQDRHTSCPSPDPSFMPSRVLEVSRPESSILQQSGSTTTEPGIDIVYLQEFGSSPVMSQPYTALSYCWGSPEHQVLTRRDRISQFTNEGIPLANLPLTIQDAVLVTRRLGIRFLWVDALCIVQDDEAEKAAEIARMAHIYRNALVTISAAAAAAVNDGFLGRREIWSGEGLAPIWLPWKMTPEAKEHEWGRIGFFHNLMTNLWFQDPIHRRAWTMQETLLSTRLLVYGRHQIYFACMQAARFGAQAIGGNTTAIHKLRAPIESYRVTKNRKVWRDIMVEYSARRLSVLADKLPAMASVAAAFGPAEDYLAGIWRDELPPNLLWETKTRFIDGSGSSDSGNNALCTAPTTKRRIREWRAPSWSWMSVDGPIELPSDKVFKSQGVLNGLKVVEARVEPMHSFDRFGQIKDASLTLHGSLTEMELDPEACVLYRPNEREHKIAKALLDAWLEDTGRVCHTYSEGAIPNPLVVFGLPIQMGEQLDAVTGKPMGTVIAGLIVVKADITSGSPYKRIGKFYSLPSTRAEFSRDDPGLPVYELPVSFYESNTDVLLDGFQGLSIHGGYDGEEVVHSGVRCIGKACQKSDTTTIKGPRYFCVECQADYCRSCKDDRANHEYEWSHADESWHRFCLFPLPVADKLFEGDWKKHGVAVTSPGFRDIRLV